MITLLGAKNSGKTVFLIALYYAIIKKKKKWRIIPGSEQSVKFIDNRRRELIQNHHFPEPTRPGDQERIFNFDMRTPGFLRWGYRDIKFDLLDPAGEFFENPELEVAYKNIITRSIRKSRGLICLIEPEPKNKNDYFSLLLTHFSKMRAAFQSRFVRGYQPIPIPVALCISKMDQYDNFIADPVHFDIETFAQKTMGESTFQMLTHYFKSYKVFGVSSIGWDEQGRRNYFVDEDGNIRPIGEPKPVHVFETVEWLLEKRVRYYDFRKQP
jgi:hypothetical protein